jgi:hypothetical protein
MEKDTNAHKFIMSFSRKSNNSHTIVAENIMKMRILAMIEGAVDIKSGLMVTNRKNKAGSNLNFDNFNAQFW